MGLPNDDWQDPGYFGHVAREHPLRRAGLFIIGFVAVLLLAAWAAALSSEGGVSGFLSDAYHSEKQ